MPFVDGRGCLLGVILSGAWGGSTHVRGVYYDTTDCPLYLVVPMVYAVDYSLDIFISE